MASKETVAATATEAKFSKAQLIGAKKYNDRRDLLNVLLAEDKRYTLAEVDKAIADFMKRGVK